MTWLKSRD